jgi:hypothetical protein
MEPFKSVSSVPSWAFGARQLQQQLTQARPSKRLHSSSKARQSASSGARLQAQQQQQQQQHKLKVLVAGYSVKEAANDLLPLLLEFAPAGSSVVIAVVADNDTSASAEDQGQQQQQSARQQLPEGLDWEGQLEADEEPQHAGAAPVLHSISYRCAPVCPPKSCVQFLEQCIAVVYNSQACAALAAADLCRLLRRPAVR